jgi:hypothetical protein
MWAWQIQPSELLKIAMPLMLAWWFQKREGQLRLPDFAAAFGLLLLPVGLIAKQPDLGTGLLVLGAALRDLLRRPVLEADPAGAALAVAASSRWWPRGPHLPARRDLGAAADTRSTASAPCWTRPPTRWARASTSSRA